MKTTGALVGVLIALVIGYFVYRAELSGGTDRAVPPQEQIDTMGVTHDLLAIAQAERLYLAAHGTYASIDNLQQEGSITFSGRNRRGYTYVAEVDGGDHFKVTAAPADPAKSGWPTFSVDDTMQVNRQ